MLYRDEQSLHDEARGGDPWVPQDDNCITTLFQDVAEFGGEKHITVGVATLVPLPSPSADNNNNKTSSSPYLEIKAASSIIELAVVGKKLQRRFQ